MIQFENTYIEYLTYIYIYIYIYILARIRPLLAPLAYPRVFILTVGNTKKNTLPIALAVSFPNERPIVLVTVSFRIIFTNFFL